MATEPPLNNPNLNLTAEEKRVFYQLFQAADKTNLGVITGETAVSFFEKTNLNPETLGLIWQIADSQNRGLLTPSGFGVVLRLIGHAQAGRQPTEELAFQPGPLPTFAGIKIDASSSAAVPPSPFRVPPLNPDQVSNFIRLFERSDTQNGFISGEVAKQIFERARLPNEILGRIWNLADSNQRGVLEVTEFVIAMHLLTAYKSGAMKGVPPSLPPGLYDHAARRTGALPSIGPQVPSDIPPVPAIPKQYTGPGLQRTQSPLGRNQTGGDWLITPQEKAHFDNVFSSVDKLQNGTISGDQAVGFFSNARLPEEVLAQVWDLADIDSDGYLNKDEFAVAMYLVRQQRTTKEPLPLSLPPALIPPSMRRPSSMSPRPLQPNVTGARSAADDLLGLDVFTAPAQVPLSTGNSTSTPQAPSSPKNQLPSTIFKPFIPSSSFGQALSPHRTGSQGSPAALPMRSPPPADDLLGDADPEESKKLTQEATDLGNLSNQVSTLSKEMQNVQTKRGTTEQDLAQVNQQRKDFEARLQQARTMYAAEVESFKALEQQLAASRAATNKVRQEFTSADATRRRLQQEFAQVSAALEIDQRENASLKEKIKEANAQVSKLKPQLEKAKSEARQQKGLVAINKKQLATIEGERDRSQEEIKSLSSESLELESQKSPISGTSPFGSPAASTGTPQTNPFFRRATTMSSDNTLSPQVTGPQQPISDAQNVFDNMFGSSYSAGSTSTPPPPTTFKSPSPLPAAEQTPVVEHKTPIEAATTSTPSAETYSEEAVFGNPNASPPPPPLSRQITASGLPIEGHQETEDSSIKPSPPASRFGTSTSEATNQSASGVTTPQKKQSPFDDERKEETPAEIEAAEIEAAESSQPSVPGAFPTVAAQPTKRDVSFDELFGGPAHQRSQSQQASDFEEAFAVMKKKGDRPKANGTEKDTTGEFPPIQELDDDDEDDSTESESHGGFDDNFTPASPPRKTTSSSQNDFDSDQQAFTFPPIVSNTSPGIDSGALSSMSNASTTPKVSLTDKELPTPSGKPSLPVDSGKSIPGEAGVPQNNEPKDPGTKAGGKAAASDFEAAFAGLDLAPAKEADDDGEEEDDFESAFNRDPSNFDMIFDSPGSATKPGAPTSNNANPNFGDNMTNADFFSFQPSAADPPSSNQSPFSQPPKPVSGANPVGNAPSGHDWDALFSVLDNTKAPTDAKPPSTSPATKENLSAMAFPQPPNQSKEPGWALNSSGEDDLILQRLTSMGYARDESLAALEKFDYNIDKVGYSIN
ncbi:hypothetical protein FQN57_003358 [Myotisia sp. PD_48]|nr:hypothetical protein FQN57_003358 [Myotisia sp. PD_48]